MATSYVILGDQESKKIGIYNFLNLYNKCKRILLTFYL